MNNLLILFFLGGLALLFSCDENTKYEPVPIEIKKVIKIKKVDSSSYFDSLYAPLIFKIDTFFNRRFKEKTFNGTVLYAKNNRIVFKKAYGFSTLETKDSLTTESTFQLASASKPFTAIATLMLVEQGKLKLTDSVQKYILNFPYKGITIEQLLSHRSGLSQYTHFCDAPDSIWPDKHKTITNNDVLNIMADIVPITNYTPNTKFYYCNTNYLLLASIIEKITKKKFEEHLKNVIFSPLEMNSTVVYNRTNKDDLIKPVKAYNGAYNPYTDIYLNGVVGDKGVYSSVEDLFRFYKGLSNGKLISKEMLSLAISPKNETRINGKNYGYGFRLLQLENEENIIFHTGWWKGFRIYFIMNNELNKLAVVLTNVKRGPFLSAEKLLELVDRE